jgi:O-antigen ligase/polysaccharide polymerase Wzy-like membrane protein
MDLALAVGGGLGEAAEKLGLVATAATAALVLALKDPRQRALAMACAIVLVPVVLVGHIWDSEQFRSISDDTPVFVTLVLGGVAAVTALAAVFVRRQQLLPLLAVAALPFRVPIEAAGTTSNLLVPLYLVIAAAAVAHLWRQAAGEETAAGPSRVRAIELALALFISLYALQSLYSNDLDTALEQMVFFYVPFALLAKLLSEVRWTRQLLLGCVAVLLALALVFVGIGFWEYDRRELLWNPKVISANQFESYFRVNSVFWDPNVYGRFLVLVILTVAALMLWNERRRLAIAAAVVLAVLWAGLVLTFSQSSFASLLVGLAVLAAIRWNVRRTLAVSALAVGLGGLFVLAFQDSLRLDLESSSGLSKATSGRSDLIQGGVNLFADRPVWGYGSGSFARTFRREHKGNQEEATSASHTLPVTVAAEQGLIGLGAYLFVLFASFGMLLGRAGWAKEPARGPPVESPHGRPERHGGFTAAQAVFVATFAALVTHTMMYAAFLEDPLTWVILGVAPSATPAAVEAAPATA